MSLKPSLTNANNWEFVTTLTGASSQDIGGAHIPIVPLICPVLLSSKTLAISSDSQNAPDSWNFGGNVSMKINTGITVGGNFTTHGITGRKLHLREITLIVFPDICDDYSLVIYPPKWFLNATYSIFEYIGTGKADLAGKLDSIYEQLTTA